MENHIQRLRKIFTAALAVPSIEDRRAYLDKVCGDDLTLRAEVESLLSADQAADDFLKPLVPAPESWPELPAVDLPQQIGPYKIREQIGEGGLGVVYVAEQLSPVRRKVALKVIKPGMDTKEVIARFEAERQALAMMDHPNIARVFDAGTTETGRPYFVMELIRGVPITKFCQEQKLSLPDRLRLFVDVCRAVQHAHQKGIIHRDLKPSNILITLHDGVPVVKVIDFGISKALTQQLTDKTIYTRHTQIVGTPMYMSPEQAELSGLDIDTRSDVYSLGVLLYELLTGGPPFDREALLSKGIDEMRRVLREDEPPRPSHRISTLDVDMQSTLEQERGVDARQLCLTLKRELDWIVMRALEKDRDRRYESASEFAADVERYLNDEQVSACPPSLGYRLRKAVKRQKALLVTGALVLLTALIGMAVSLDYASKANTAALEAKVAQTEAEQHAEDARRNAVQAKQAHARAEVLLYASDMKLASDAIANEDIPRAAELLDRHVPRPGQTDLRGFEWYYFQQRITVPESSTLKPGGWVDDADVSPSGAWLAACGAEGKILIYRTSDWKEHRSFATGGDSINGLAWSPDDRFVAAACPDGSVQVWEVQTGARTLQIPAHPGGANHVIFNRDGNTLYSCGSDPLVKQWDVKTGEQTLVYRGHERQIRRIALSPDGTKLATASSDTSFVLWNAETGEILSQILSESEARFSCVAFSPNGRLLAAGDISGDVYLLDTDTGDLRPTRKVVDGVEDLIFLRDGQWLATADRGGAIQWHRIQADDHEDGHVPLRWIAHEGRILTLTASHDGRRLISGGRDGFVRVWTPKPDAVRWTASKQNLPVHLRPYRNRLDFSIGAGDEVFFGRESIWVLDLGKRRLLDRFAESEGFWRWVECSRNGRYLAAVQRGRLVLFDVPTRELLRKWPIEKNADPGRLAISSDGRWTAHIAKYNHDVLTIYDRDHPQQHRRLPVQECKFLKFSPDGRWLAVAAREDNGIRVWDLKNFGPPRELLGHSDSVFCLAFSPDSKTLASASNDRMLKLWRPETGELVFSIVTHPGPVVSVAFSPDGRTLATAGDDPSIRLWHAATGQPLGTLASEPGHTFTKIRFSRDGKKLVAMRNGSTIVVYDASPYQGPSKRTRKNKGTNRPMERPRQ